MSDPIKEPKFDDDRTKYFPKNVWRQLQDLASDKDRLLLQEEASPDPITTRGHGLQLRLWKHFGEGDRVLFLHGYLDTGRSWDAVCASLSKSMRCSALDWRGHGQSEEAGRGASHHLQDHLKDLHGVVTEAQEIEDPFAMIVAHSMGANLALMYAAAFPEHVPRLLLVDGCGPPSEAPEDQPGRWRNLLLQGNREHAFRPVKDANEAIERLLRFNGGLTRQGAARMVRHALFPSSDGFLFPFSGRLRGPTPVRFPEETWLSACARISGKVVLLRAEFGYVPEGEPMTSRMSAMNAMLEQIAGAHHHLHVDRPQLIADAALRLLVS
ncbi:MAG: alpha/beta hydrolase [Deltaproteobacteria bacterium]|nr:alpha/beta hydrolase [Deltaproteobacteria bacterium]